MRIYSKYLSMLTASFFSISLAGAAPTFEQFPAKPEPVPATGHLKLKTRQDREYRSALRQAASASPNFAGHYVVANIGCGASCLLTAAIDTRTGRVTWLPDTICCWNESVSAPVAYRLDSELMILQGRRNEQDEGIWYWRLENGRFRLLRP